MSNSDLKGVDRGMERRSTQSSLKKNKGKKRKAEGDLGTGRPTKLAKTDDGKKSGRRGAKESVEKPERVSKPVKA